MKLNMDIRVTFIFAWYDIWVGIFIDRKKHCFYVFPLPMLGLKVEWRKS